MIFSTLSDATAEIKSIVNGGQCKDTTVYDRINQATRRIMNRTKKPIHVRRLIRFYTQRDIITLPHEVDKVLHYTMDGVPKPMFSQAYEFVSHGPGEIVCNGNISGKYLEDLGNHYSLMFDLPSYDQDDSTGEPFYTGQNVVAFSTARADLDVPIRIRGRGKSNEALGQNGTGVDVLTQIWDNGVEGNILDQDVLSRAATDVRDITYISKPVTEGFISIYTWDTDMFDPATSEDSTGMRFLGKYHPYETQPRYRRYRITSPGYGFDSSILAWCELGYIPLSHPEDILIVQNIDALKMMVMAIGMENERDFQLAKAYEADAYRLIEEQRNSERTHDANLMSMSDCYGFGDVRKV